MRTIDKVDIEVICTECNEERATLSEPAVQMIGDGIMHGNSQGMQVREYTCPSCKKQVSVVLIPHYKEISDEIRFGPVKRVS